MLLKLFIFMWFISSNFIFDKYNDKYNFVIVATTPEGYIIFQNEAELKTPGISLAKRINIPKGISSLKVMHLKSPPYSPHEVSAMLLYD